MKSGSMSLLVLRNTVLQFASQGVSLAVGLALNFILARYFGLERFGEYNYVFAFFFFFLTLNDFGINTVAVREISKQPETAGRTLGSLLILKLIIAGLSMSAVAAITFFFDFTSDLERSLQIYMLILPLIALQMPALIYQVRLDFRIPVMAGITARIATLLLVLWGVSRGFRVHGMIGIVVGVEAGYTLLLLAGCWKDTRLVLRPSWDIWKSTLQSSLVLGATGLLASVVARLDFLMLERMASLADVGLYATCYRVTSLLETLPIFMMNTIYPLMARFAKEDPSRLVRIFRRSTLVLAATGIPLALLISLFAEPLMVLLFGPEFSRSAEGLRILVWGSAAIFAAMPASTMLISTGREKLNLVIYSFAASANFGLNMLWIPDHGFQGAAMATVLTLSGAAAVQFLLAERTLLSRFRKIC